MNHERPQPPLDLTSLLPRIDAELIALLKSLTPEEWEKQTIATKWKVKDVAAHLLDGNIRVLSMLRDGYTGEKQEFTGYMDLVNYLNNLNRDWVQAMKRVSPPMLIFMLEQTGPAYCNYYASLDPLDLSPWPVAWAGESQSFVWMHVAREYSEKWLHQQQIRDAVNKPGLMIREYFFPLLSIFLYALPHTYRNVEGTASTAVMVTIPGDAGGSWYVSKLDEGWKLGEGRLSNPLSEVIIDADTAWKLFSKSIRPKDVEDKVVIRGSEKLGRVALEMISVMA